MDARDAILYATCPLVPAPTLAPFEPLGAPGKRLIAARDGMYLEARSHALHCLQRVAEFPTPYGLVSPFLRLLAGPVPAAMIREIARQSLSASPFEIAFIIHREAEQYVLHTPQPISASAGHVTYADERDPDRLVLDIHSHGAGRAFFSVTDDQSDLSRQGPYIAGVIAPRLEPAKTRMTFRLVCPPYLIDLDAESLKDVIA